MNDSVENILEKYMLKFDIYELIEYLGQDMIDLLVEWHTNGNNLLNNKQSIVKMIYSLYGTSILENKKFRRDLLLHMDQSDILSIRDNCLKGKDTLISEPVLITEKMVEKPWNHNNTIGKYLLHLLKIPSSVLDKEKDDSVVENDVVAGDEQFYELLDYQYCIEQRVLNILNSGKVQQKMLVHMPTGTGKTKTSMHIITNYLNFSLKKKGLVIWVAHTTELLQQAYDTFVSVWRHLGDGHISAYKLWGNKTIQDTNEPLNGVVFCGLAKLMSIADTNPNLYEKLRKDSRLVVFDEAHKAAAPQTQKVIKDLLLMPQGYENRALLGLTATPGRTTEDSYDNNLLTYMFDGNLIHIDAEILNQINLGPLRALNTTPEENVIKYFQERRILAKMKLQKLSYKTFFSEAEIRTLRGSLADMGFDEKEYTTKMLSSMLELEGIRNSIVIGDMDPIDRKKAIDIFKDRESGVDIIINYEVLTTGFDSKNIKCVFITRPTKSIVLYSQMLGRGLRGPLMGGNEECLLIDIDDNLQAFDNETAFSHFNDYWHV